MDTAKIQKYLQSKHEHMVAKDIIVPLLQKMGCADAQFCEARDEEVTGTDIRYSTESEPDKVRKFTGIQIKRHNIDARAASDDSVTELVNQATKAFSKPFVDIVSKQEYSLSRYVICSYGKITEPAKTHIMDRLKQSKFDKDIDFWPGELVARYINDYYLEPFIRYFKIDPGELDEVDEAFLKNLFLREFGRQATETEIRNLWNFAKDSGIKPKEVVDTLHDPNTKETLTKLYRDLLGRGLDPVGHIRWGHRYRRLPDKQLAVEDIGRQIQLSPEYVSKYPIVYEFRIHPHAEARFERLHQVSNGWVTYHGRHHKGKLRFLEDESAGTQIAELQPLSVGSSFRLQFPVTSIGVKKQRVRLVFKTENFFEFFVLLLAGDGKPYYVTYKSADDPESKHSDGEIEYAVFSTGKEILNGEWQTLEKNFEEDLKSIYNVGCDTVLHFAFNVTGPFSIKQITLT